VILERGERVIDRERENSREREKREEERRGYER